MSQIHIDNVKKSFRLGSVEVQALNGVSLSIQRGEFLALAGPSGSGKTTLLNIIGCLESPTDGRVFIENTDVATLSDNALSDLRAKNIGFVFQNFNLLPVLTALENVEYPLLPRGGKSASKRNLAERVLHMVGLTEFAHHTPSELSGGQRQRVAIARTIVANPRIILADEPTANLDQKTGSDILRLIKSINKSLNTTIVFSTHDPRIIELAERVIRLADGVIVEDK